MPFPFEVSVVGVSWHQEAISLVKIGDEIEVRPDPLNPHDANARVVMSSHGPLGHLSRALAGRLAGEHPGVLHGVVVERLGTVTTGLRLNIVSEDAVLRDESTPSKEPTVVAVDLHGSMVVSVRASGRVLGRFVSQGEDGVRVLLDDGGEVVLGSDVVEVTDYEEPSGDMVPASGGSLLGVDFDLD
jgi:hypothetical protein